MTLCYAGACAAGPIVVVAIAGVVPNLPNMIAVTLEIRLATLLGLLAMAVAALMAPFLEEIRRVKLYYPFPRTIPFESW